MVQGENLMKSRKMIPQIKLSDAQKKKLNDEIKAFYLDERGEEIGIIEQMQLLELFEQKMALLFTTRPWMMPSNGFPR